MEVAISYILISGVVISLVLLVIGTAAYAWQHHSLALGYSLPQDNLFQFIRLEFSRLAHGSMSATDIINLGIITLMLTPFIRVMFSAFAFALVERNLKYTLFTSFVLAVLTYSLFLRR